MAKKELRAPDGEVQVPMLNSKEYWDRRFQTDWEQRHGPNQTKFFADLVVRLMPAWLRREIIDDGLTVCDWGCAMGDAMPVWAGMAGADRVAGYDLSAEAIRTATSRFPQYAFHEGSPTTCETKYDVLVSSNVLEHLVNPFADVQDVARSIRRYLVFLVPFEEDQMEPEHVWRFASDTIPLAVSSWQLLHFSVRDVSREPDTRWRGRQVLLVYGKPRHAAARGIMLAGLCPDIESVIRQKEYGEALLGVLEEATKAEVDRILGDKASLEEQLAEVRSREAGLASCSTELQVRVAELTQACGLLEKDRDALRNTLEAVETERSELARQRESARGEMSELRHEAGALRDGIHQKVREIGSLRQESDRLRAREEALARDKEEHVKAVCSLRDELAEERASKEALAQEVAQVEAVAVKDRADLADLQKKLDDERRAKEALAQKVAQLEAVAAVAAKDRADLADLQKKLDDERRAKEALAQKVAQLEAVAAAAAKDCAELADIKSSRSYRMIARINGWRSRRQSRRAKARIAAAPAPTTVPDVDVSGQAKPPGAMPPGRRPRIGVILDEFSHACFAPEAELLPFTPADFASTLSASPADFVFVESAWNGNQGAWQYRIAQYAARRDGLSALREWCRRHETPLVFWNKEDPPHFNDFLVAAREADFVFTTDAHCIPRYCQSCGHDRVYALPFAAQPRIHTPILTAPREERVCFAGTYHADKFDHRRRDMQMMLAPAMDFGLTIYDRMHGYTGPAADRYRFPEALQLAIKGSLPYDEMVRAYRRFRVFLNVNSVKTSPTMLSRRVFELLACGTPVISSESAAICDLFGPDIVLVANTKHEVRAHLEMLLGDPDAWARRSARGIRCVLRKHTYAHRLQEVCRRIGVGVVPPKEPHVHVLARASSAEEARRLCCHVSEQERPADAVVLVGPNPSELRDVQGELARRLGPAQALLEIVGDDALTGHLASIDDSDLVAVMGPNDRYGREYLGDVWDAVVVLHQDAVGKACFYAVDSQGHARLHGPPQMEHQIVADVAGGTLAGRRRALDEKVLRSALTGGTVCVGSAYAGHRFGYLQAGEAPPSQLDAVAEERFAV